MVRLIPCNAFMKALGAKSSTGIPHSQSLTLFQMPHPSCFFNPSPQQCHPPDLHSLLSLISRWKGWLPHPRHSRMPLPLRVSCLSTTESFIQMIQMCQAKLGTRVLPIFTEMNTTFWET